jgi:hypothetical protein
LLGPGFDEPRSIEEATLVIDPDILPPEVVVLLTIFKFLSPLLMEGGY